jgi:hypothetical protein
VALRQRATAGGEHVADPHFALYFQGNLVFSNGVNAPDCRAPHGTQQLSGYTSPTADQQAPVAGPVPPSTIVQLAVGLPIRDPEGLQNFINQVSDPHSSNYRQYLSVADFKATYGATDPDYKAVNDWAQAQGLTVVRTFANNLLLRVSGTAAQIGQALFANLIYRSRPDGTQFFALDREPSLNLTPTVLRITGLTDFAVPRPLAPPPSPTLNGTANGNNYWGRDLRAAYLGAGTICQNLDGTGQVIGLLEADGNTFNANDVVLYEQAQNPPLPVATPPLLTGNVVVVSVEAVPPFMSIQAGEVSETLLDIDTAQAMAPNAQILIFEGASGITNFYDSTLHAMATDGRLTVASNSQGFGNNANERQAISEMAAQGISFFDASGDNGDVGDPEDNTDIPNQTVVGGTVLSTNAACTTPSGSCFPPYPASYYNKEDIWQNGNGTTGGGIMDANALQGCSCFPSPTCCNGATPIPGYQKPVDMSTNGGSSSFRNYPDVAALADNVQIILNGVQSTQAGTSASAPLWAGFMALANQRAKQLGVGPVGFANPVLYDIGLTRGSANDLYSVCFHDIADGADIGAIQKLPVPHKIHTFPSVAGYDLSTGWGTPTCQLISQLSTATPLTMNTTFAGVELLISTGQDNIRSDSEAKADIQLPSGSTPASLTVQLKSQGEPEWKNGSVHSIVVPLNGVSPPLRVGSGIAQITLHLIQHNAGGAFADNWDVSGLNARLINPGPNPEFCQLDLGPTNTLQDGHLGVVRLSENPGPSGVGGSATFAGGSGCASTGSPVPPSPAEVQLIISTGSDNLRDLSEGWADLFGTGASTPFQSIMLKNTGEHEWETGSNHDKIFALTANAPALGSVVLRIVQHHDLANLGDDTWKISGVNFMTWDANAPEVCVSDLQGDDFISFSGSTQPFVSRSGCP